MEWFDSFYNVLTIHILQNWFSKMPMGQHMLCMLFKQSCNEVGINSTDYKTEQVVLS
jgi:hypothetical protein